MSRSTNLRADAQRNLDTLLQAAKEVFATSGVDAPVREIAEKAGVGVGTLYRHFPQRANLIAGVFRRELDACVEAAGELGALGPAEALERWLHRFAGFVGTKKGLSAALHSGDPVYQSLPAYFDARLRPTLADLLSRAEEAGAIRRGTDPNELLSAVVGLCHAETPERPGSALRMISLLVAGLTQSSLVSGDSAKDYLN
jgi:AcrR family transcriptional regulator